MLLKGIMAAIFPNLVDTLMADTLIATDFSKQYNSPGEVGAAWEANARKVIVDLKAILNFDIQKLH